MGTITFTPLTAGTYRTSTSGGTGEYEEVYYMNAESISEATNIDLSDGQTASGIDMQLTKKSTISGKILDADGNPIADRSIRARLYQFYDDGEYWNEVYSHDGYANNNGEYQFINVPRGTYRVKFEEETYATQMYQAEYYDDVADIESATDVVVDDGSDVVLNDALLAKLGSVSGTVTNGDGTPIGGTAINLYKRSGDEAPYYWAYIDQHYQATTGSSGTYTVEGVESGIYRIRFSESYAYSTPTIEYGYEYYNDAATIEDGTDVLVGTSEDVIGIDAVLGQPSMITGIVTDPNGEPLANIYAELLRPDEYDDGESTTTYWENITDVYTDENGQYKFGGSADGFDLRAGTYRICFNDYGDSGYIRQCYSEAADPQTTADITVGLNETISNIDVAMLKAGEISGTITDSDGTLLENVNIRFYRYDASAEEWIEPRASQDMYLVSDTDGAYTLPDMLPGTYRLHFISDEIYGEQYYGGAMTAEDSTSIELNSGDILTNINMTLVSRSTISGKVTDENGIALESIFVGVYARSQPVSGQAVFTPSNVVWDLIRSEVIPNAVSRIMNLSSLPLWQRQLIHGTCSGIWYY